MSNISLYNTLSSQVEVFIPQEPGKVSLYCCGVTVYDHCHIGHGRIFITLDLLLRFFQQEGYDCTFIRNITDVDDKILKRASEQSIDWKDLTETYIKSMQSLCESLGCLPVTHEPKATESISQIIAIIEKLIEKKHAYIKGGEVFFSVASYPDYGKLSHQDRNALEAGQRVAIHEQKEHAHDFTLWKPATDAETGWDSPFGRGRPGWHIECSAMISQLVKGPLDFHMGGMDLKFPHHENEIAQSEACHDHLLSQSWLHVGFVTVDGEKMSKSLDNFKYLSEFLEVVPADVTRYLYLSTHYRQPLALSGDKIESVYGALRSLGQALGPYQAPVSEHALDLTLIERLTATLREDLNTPEALVSIHAAVKEMAHLKPEQATMHANTIMHWSQKVLGLNLCALYQPVLEIENLPAEVQSLILQREIERKSKNYAQADLLRKSVQTLGYEIIDRSSGPAAKVLV